MEVGDLGQGHQVRVITRRAVDLVLAVSPEEVEGYDFNFCDVGGDGVQGLVDGWVVAILSAVVGVLMLRRRALSVKVSSH